MVNQFYGKTVYIGLDVHKKSFALWAISDGKQVSKASMNSSHEGLISYIAKYFGGRFLDGNGITCLVVPAASIEVSSRDRVKTDKLEVANNLYF